MLIRWCSPHAFLFSLFSFPFSITFFFPPTSNPLINAFKPTHCAGWVCLLASHQSKRVPHGTQSMGFEDIHQPKSRCVFHPWLCFCLFFLPCSSVANLQLLLILLSVAQSNSCKFHLFRFSAIQILEPTCFPCKNLLLIVCITILKRSLK